ncbi:MAG: DUF1573 domain-containing protein [Chitinophagaceae bacterium]|nr:DUF1573 domain-containing protein [Chitinophagaceae bacterium]MCW5906218.1 DUF1573 domain-containing protein [Chitinophagaceae bacterium]
MKKCTFILAAMLFTFGAYAQQKTETTAETVKTQQPKDVNKVLEFKNAEYDFGKIPFGKSAEYSLTIKNISKEPVTLERVQVSCGCTTPKYQQGEKIAPNESATVTLGFNGNSQGHFSKSVTLYFSDGMSRVVTFKGETYKTPEESAPANKGVEKMKKSGK